MLKLGATAALSCWDPLKPIDFTAEECSSSKTQTASSVISNISYFMFKRAHLFSWIIIGRNFAEFSFTALKVVISGITDRTLK